MRDSIRHRLNLSSLLLMLLFLGLTGLLLQSAQLHSLETGVKNHLLSHVYALLGVADVNPEGQLSLPPLSDPRLNQPDSGLYAAIASEQGQLQWQSPSLLGVKLPPPTPLEAGQNIFHQDDLYYLLDYGIEWALTPDSSRHFTLRIAQARKEIEQQAASFRTRLWLGLLGLAIALLIAQSLVLHWSLHPLRRIAKALGAVESGDMDDIQGHYPKELQPLADNLNALLHHNQVQRERYRNSLDDLAHSIKTPLALLKGALEDEDNNALREATRQAVPHIDSLVRGRLNQTSIGGDGLVRRVPLKPLLQRLTNTLSKVYREPGLQVQWSIDEDYALRGNENDLLELFGNLLDNACKYGRGKMRLSATLEGELCHILIEDNGPGIPEDQIQEVLNRGTRLDEQQAGQGIGLAASQNSIKLYKGTLSILRSKNLGGTAIQVSLKQHQ